MNKRINNIVVDAETLQKIKLYATINNVRMYEVSRLAFDEFFKNHNIKEVYE